MCSFYNSFQQHTHSISYVYPFHTQAHSITTHVHSIYASKLIIKYKYEFNNKMIDFIQKETQYKVALLILVIFCLVETLAFLIYLSVS